MWVERHLLFFLFVKVIIMMDIFNFLKDSVDTDCVRKIEWDLFIDALNKTDIKSDLCTKSELEYYNGLYYMALDNLNLFDYLSQSKQSCLEPGQTISNSGFHRLLDLGLVNISYSDGEQFGNYFLNQEGHYTLIFMKLIKEILNNTATETT